MYKRQILYNCFNALKRNGLKQRIIKINFALSLKEEIRLNGGDKIHRCKVNKEEIMTEILCGIMLVAFFVVMIGVGFYSRKHATNVSGFVLGGRSVGPWLTAFAFGTSYFSAVIFVGYAGQFGWNFGLSLIHI